MMNFTFQNWRGIYVNFLERNLNGIPDWNPTSVEEKYILASVRPFAMSMSSFPTMMNLDWINVGRRV